MKKFDIIQRLNELRIKQIVAPSDAEKRFLNNQNLTPIFHPPVPNNFGILLFPISVDLVKELERRISNFRSLNSCCASLAHCSNLYYSVHKDYFDKLAPKILLDWSTAIKNGIYYTTTDLFKDFKSRTTVEVDLDSDLYSSLQTRLCEIPGSLINAWQISIVLDKEITENVLQKICESLLFSLGNVHSIEIIPDIHSVHRQHEKINIYVSETATILQIINFMETFEANTDKVCESNSHFYQKFGFGISSRIIAQRGTNALKSFLLSIDKLKLYYLSDFKFSVSSFEEVSLIRNSIKQNQSAR